MTDVSNSPITANALTQRGRSPAWRFAVPRSRRIVSIALLSGLLASQPALVLAGAGHDHGSGAFQEGAASSSGSVKIAPETAKRLGIRVESVVRKPLAFGIRATGQIETLPSKRVEVTTPIAGTVTQLFVQPGDVVQAGDAVALLSSPDLAELRVGALEKRAEAQANTQQAEADLRLAQQNYTQQRQLAAADVNQAQTDVKVAQERYDRDRELLEKGAIPRRQVLESEANLSSKKAALAKAESRLPVAEAEAQLGRARSQVQVAQSRVTLSDETYAARLRQLGATANDDGTVTVTAPISGIVAEQKASLGESGQDAGKPLMTLVDSTSVIASANVYEKDLSQVSVGQRVRVSVAGKPNRFFDGRITVIKPTVDGQTRIVPVQAELDNAGGTLKPGMTADLEILTDRTPVAVLTIPRSAVVEVNKEPTVYIQNGNAFQATTVELGRVAGDRVEVKRGLFEGDQVVTQRANQLYAQSLKGGGGSDDHAAEPKVTPAASLSLWWLIAGGGAIAASTFMSGMYVARRRTVAVATPSTWQNPQAIDGSGGTPVVPLATAHDDEQQQA